MFPWTEWWNPTLSLASCYPDVITSFYTDLHLTIYQEAMQTRGCSLEPEPCLLGKHHTLHTKEAHERFLMSRSLISRLAGQEKMVQQLLSVGLALSSILEKARARD
jgi:hypothetical protein